jgi:hypothetical protein
MRILLAALRRSNYAVDVANPAMVGKQLQAMSAPPLAI